MIHVFREKDFFSLFLFPFSWRVSQSPIRVVILFYMDHIIIIIGEWRSDAICNDPRLWINHGSTMDQHGSTWIKRPSACRPRLMCPASWLMCPASWLMCPASWLMRPRIESIQRHDSRLMAHVSTLRASGVLTHAPRVHASCSTRHAPRVRRSFSRSFSRSIQPPRRLAGGISHRLDQPINALLFRSIELNGAGQYCSTCLAIHRNGAKQERKDKTTIGRGAHSCAAAYCRSYVKGRHNAGPVHSGCRLVCNLMDLHFIA